MKLIVDKKQRLAKMRAHTGTHLLHAALDKILWGTKQAGSLVDEDYLRFDFTSEKLLNSEQLKQIEDIVNKWISQWYNVIVEEMSLDEAKKKWAKAFFDDKYGDIVRVVQVVDDEGNPISIELCGWTHVSNTSQVGAFKIIDQVPVASGIKRIVAVTGPKVAEYFRKEEEKIEKIASSLGVNSKKLEEKINAIVKDYAELKDKLSILKDKYLQLLMERLLANAKKDDKFDYIIKVPVEILDLFKFKEIVNYLKNKYWNTNFLVYNDEGVYAINVWKWDFNAKEYIREKGLKWWGNERFVQWKWFRL